MAYIAGDPLLTVGRLTIENAATNGQTSIPIPGGFTPGIVDVYVGGAALSFGDYDDSDGQQIALAKPMAAGTQYRVVTYAPSSVVAMGNYVKKTGDTMSGTLTATALNVQTPAGAVSSQLSAQPGYYAHTLYSTVGSPRWAAGKDNTAESGSNAGSNYFFNSYKDDGTYLATPFTIARATGLITLNGGAVINGGATVGGGLTSSSTLVVGGSANIVLKDASNNILGYVGPHSPGVGFINAAGTQWNFYTDDNGNCLARGNINCGSVSCSGSINTSQGSMTVYGWSGNNGNGVIYFGNTGNKYLYWDSSAFNFQGGQVSISGPGNQLRMVNTSSGNYWQTGVDNNTSYTIFNSGNIGQWMGNGGTTWNAQSDERLKNIKGEITDAITKVKQIRSVLYTWKSDETEKLRVGVIAQDVQKVQPESVSEHTDGFLGVAYTELIPLLLASVREISDKLDSLGSRVATLEGAKS